MSRQGDHVAVGWNEDRNLRWIEVGCIRLEEDDKGAIVTALPDRPKGCWLSAAELAGLVRTLAAWFADDPTATIRQIERRAKHVRAELEAWNERARIDEEHPPYDELTRALDALLADCRQLREDTGKFADQEKKTVTVEEGAI